MPSDNGFHGRRVSTGEIEAGVHVEPEPPVGVDVRPEKRRERAPLVWTDEVVEFGYFQDRLDQKRVDVHEPALEQVQCEHRHFGVLTIGAGEIAVLAVEDDGVAGVPVLHHLQPAVDFAP